MRYCQKTVVLAFVAIFVLLCGCEDWSTKPPPQESVTNTNKIRNEHGVREIKESWTFYGRRSGREIWKDQPGHICKQVHYKRFFGQIEAEDDCYYSGRTFSTSEGGGDPKSWPEWLQIHYFYGCRRFAIGVLTDNKEIETLVDSLKEEVRYPTRSGGYVGGYGRMGKTNEETLEVADTILKMWGLSRL